MRRPPAGCGGAGRRFGRRDVRTRLGVPAGEAREPVGVPRRHAGARTRATAMSDPGPAGAGSTRSGHASSADGDRSFGREVRGRTVFVTGGTGSFGQRIAAHLAESEAARVIVFSRDEKKQWEMARRYPGFTYILGDVRDRARLGQALRGVDLVFHAAALKQVPSCEKDPYEALQTNAIGSQNVCEAAIEAGVAVVVALSTDKAVKPVSAMGMTKALMEKLVIAQNLRQPDTRFCCVRYGNVMGSRGSVIPLFRQQIDEGGPVTLTNGDMTRFMMSLDDSVALVTRAMTRTQGGEIFVGKAPACTMRDLAHAMVDCYGAGRAIEIRETGSRPGEKLDETLVNEYEMQRAIETESFFEIQPEYRPPADTLTSRRPPGAEYTSANTRRLSTQAELRQLLERYQRDARDARDA